MQNTNASGKQYSFSGLTPLQAPVPPMLEGAIGYPHAARFVSFYWTPYGDEAYYDDGRQSGTGNWQGFLAYIRHPVIRPLLTDYDPGSSETEAKHTLILDRDERKLYAACMQDTNAFLRQQWPKTEPVRMSRAEWEALRTKIINTCKQAQESVTMDEINRRLGEQYALVEDLQCWLDRFLPN